MKKISVIAGTMKEKESGILRILEQKSDMLEFSIFINSSGQPGAFTLVNREPVGAPLKQ